MNTLCISRRSANAATMRRSSVQSLADEPLVTSFNMLRKSTIHELVKKKYILHVAHEACYGPTGVLHLADQCLLQDGEKWAINSHQTVNV